MDTPKNETPAEEFRRRFQTPATPMKTPGRPARPKETEEQEMNRRWERLVEEEESDELRRERRYQPDRDAVLALCTRFIQECRPVGWSAHITPSETEKLSHAQMVCIHSPLGQMAWGLSMERASWFKHLKLTKCRWDKHTANERTARLRKLLTLSALVPANVSTCKWDKHDAGDRTARGRKLLTQPTMIPKTERTPSRRRARRKRA